MGRPEDAEFDEEDRVYRKKGMDTWVLVTLLGLGALIFVFIMFKLMSPSISHNKQVLLDTERRFVRPPNTNYERAVEYARSNGDRGGLDWERLQESIQLWEKMGLQAEADIPHEEAAAWLQENVTSRTQTSGFRPRNRITEAESAKRLRHFLVEFEGTRPAEALVSTMPGEPWTTFRHLLSSHRQDGNVASLLGTADAEAEVFRSSGLYGKAIDVLEDVKRYQLLLLSPEPYADLRGKLDSRITDLRREAADTFGREMREVDRLVQIGERSRARAKLRVLIDTFGVREHVVEAEAKLEELE